MMWLGSGLRLIALVFAVLFLSYALRLYASSILTLMLALRNNLKDKANGGIRVSLHNNRNAVQLSNGVEAPFVSIHVAVYNERNVVDRLMKALTSLDYPRYEIIVVDDSNDGTTEKLLRWMRDPRVKVIHREGRRGFKGGALAEALRHTSREADFIAIFDADFIPPSNIIWRFLQSFNIIRSNHKDKVESWEMTNDIAAVQGYQRHILNAGENWITQTVYAGHCGNYLVERVFVEKVWGIKMIAGSVFMIRADLLRRYVWKHSLTEDWELTLRLYRDGYKVVYDPSIAAPAECPNNLKALIRQAMRWAEGHTYITKKYFKDILTSKFIRIREKIEFLYLAPYYISSLFFVVGTPAWLISDLLGAQLPMWSDLYGWLILVVNLLAIPITSLVGLFVEYGVDRGWKGVLGTLAVMHIISPFIAFAALKGLLERREGPWIRTYKTGKITEKSLILRIRGALSRLQSI